MNQTCGLCISFEPDWSACYMSPAFFLQDPRRWAFQSSPQTLWFLFVDHCWYFFSMINYDQLLSAMIKHEQQVLNNLKLFPDNLDPFGNYMINWYINDWISMIRTHINMTLTLTFINFSRAQDLGLLLLCSICCFQGPHQRQPVGEAWEDGLGDLGWKLWG